uniref:Uncharacterized protein n=1 Tax=Aceria tosichella TaxID=561515 RepID=A0A6G1SDL8_9ACAR
MTSTPVSLNDESLNGSWIDINSASQIHSPLGEDSPELLRPALSLAESVQNLGIISFQVERFLQEAQRSGTSNTNNMSQSQQQPPPTQDGQQQQQYPNIDNISDICLSDSDLSAAEELQSSKALLDNLRRHHARRHHHDQTSNNTDNNSQSLPDYQRAQRSPKSGDLLVDQLSDSLSILSRDSMFNETCLRASAAGLNIDQTGATVTDFDWLWDWTSQPEYFTGQEWKVSASKQDYLLKQKQLYCASLASNNSQHGPERYYSGDMMSLLFLTNILSIIIGAGLTYSILMRRSNI